MVIHKDEEESQDTELNRLDRIMDEPVINERYGGMTMRDMVRKVVLRRDNPVDGSTSKSKESEQK